MRSEWRVWLNQTTRALRGSVVLYGRGDDIRSREPHPGNAAPAARRDPLMMISRRVFFFIGIPYFMIIFPSMDISTQANAVQHLKLDALRAIVKFLFHLFLKKDEESQHPGDSILTKKNPAVFNKYFFE
jgi:hypothetical protein